MKLFIEPIDVWLFRDGRPFDRGTDHLARTVFPPLPTVMQGVIRTHHIERNGGIPAYLERRLPEVEKVVGEPGGSPPDTFRLQGPFVARRLDVPGNPHDVDFYFPLPADTYLDGDTYRALKLRELEDGVITDLGQSPLLWPKDDRQPTREEKAEGGIWLNLSALETYLREGEIPKERTTAGSCLFTRERRIGIQRDDRRRATAEQMLYEAEFIRLCESVGLYVEIEGVGGWPDQGVLGIGGEGRSGRYEQVLVPEIHHIIDPNAQGFRIIFLSPAYFKQGWQADDWRSLLGTDVGFKGAAVNRPITLGGFDQAKKRQKSARRYVPVGSVYFFEGKPPLHLKSITQDGANIGFGQFIVGGW
jgi:CRISPR-associated protein Cmr3